MRITKLGCMTDMKNEGGIPNAHPLRNTQRYKFCCLYTDKSNAASNNIYKQIGYYEVGASVVYEIHGKK